MQMLDGFNQGWDRIRAGRNEAAKRADRIERGFDGIGRRELNRGGRGPHRHPTCFSLSPQRLPELVVINPAGQSGRQFGEARKVAFDEFMILFPIDLDDVGSGHVDDPDLHESPPLRSPCLAGEAAPGSFPCPFVVHRERETTGLGRGDSSTSRRHRF